MWFTICGTVLCGAMILFTPRLTTVVRKMSWLSTLIFRNFVYSLADQYGMISGEKKIAENLNMVNVSYRNLRGEICSVNLPFIKENVRVMKDKIVLLERESTTTGRGVVYQNITQEPGMPYLLSPYQMGGKRIMVYDSPNGWNDKDFMIGKGNDPLMVVTKDQRLPTLFTFTQKEEEILF